MNTQSAKPDILLFGPDTGLDALESFFKAEAPHLKTVSVESDAQTRPQDTHQALIRAAAAHNPHCVFVASPTMSLHMTDAVIESLGMPVHLALPPLAEASRLTCTRHVAFLAQPAVLAHPATRRQLGLFAERGLRVTPVSAADMTYMAHRHLRAGMLPDIMALRDIMAPIRNDARIDTVIIASSVATRLRGMLEKAAFRPFYWVDAMAVAGRRFLDSEAINATRSMSAVRKS